MRDFDPLESGSGPVEPRITSDHIDSEPPSEPGVLVDALPPNARMIVTTRNSRYRVVVIDGSERRVWITGGKLFPEPTEVLIDGAADGRSIKLGWIRVGRRVALSIGSRRITTSPVGSVVFERVPATVHAA